MIAKKYMVKAAVALMVVAAALCIAAAAFSEQVVEVFGGAGVTMEYESRLFDRDEILRIDIRIDEDVWETMLENASEEEYVSCDVVLNGETFYSVGIRPKGNTSLSAIASDPTTDRYSFKLEFDHYADGQTCYGLDKLILNNQYADATSMKEAIVYDMYAYLEADASLYNYAEVCVNGEYWGLYLALEAVEESFLLRCYGTEDGRLYKPEMEMGGGARPEGGMQMGEGTRPDGDMQMGGEARPEGSMQMGEGTRPDGDMQMGGEARPEGGMQIGGEAWPDGDMQMGAEARPEGGMQMGGEARPEGGMQMEGGARPEGGMQMGEGTWPEGGDMQAGEGSGNLGADLNYTDDELDSYTAIWDGEITEGSRSDHERVVEALKQIHAGTELEKVLDVENVLKYMAVHTFSVNMDSLSGSMAHNYYLYEHDGRLNILPWDYNLSFGGMTQGADSASEMINDAVDTPFSSTRFFDSLLENEEYLETYHEYLRRLAQEYVFGGHFEEVYAKIRGQIDEPIETDPTAFYSYEEYEAGAGMLYQTILLRAESICGQLNGEIPSTDAEQQKNREALLDASEIDVSVMGTFQTGGRTVRNGGSQGEGMIGDRAEKEAVSGSVPDGFGMPSDGGRETESVEEAVSGSVPDGFGMPPDGGRETEGVEETGGGSMFGGTAAPAMGREIFNEQGKRQTNAVVWNMILYAICLCIMILALAVAKGYPRRGKRHKR